MKTSKKIRLTIGQLVNYTMMRFIIVSSACLSISCKDHSQQSLRRDSLVYCSEGSPVTFNPQLISSNTTADAVSNTLYNMLISINHETGDIIPQLATHWDQSADGLTYTFDLRRGVQFHNTHYFTPSRHFNATDVLFSFQRILDTRHPYHYIGGGIYRHTLSDSVINIKALSMYKIQFELNRPDSTFLSNLATDYSVILSKEYADHLMKTQQLALIDKLPIGTGPFKYREYLHDELIRYYRHQDYWEQNNNRIQQLVFDITKNGSSRITKLLTHECDISAYPLPQELPLLKKRPDIKVARGAVLNVGYWAFNTSKKPLNNPQVRRALAHAINIDAIMGAVYYRQATKADSILPPISWAYHRNEQPILFDSIKARQLLEQAGYPDGFTMTIWTPPIQRDYNPNAHKMAELMQADLAKIGVKAQLISYDWTTFRKRLANGEHDSVVIGWSADNADPDNFLRPTLSCNAKASGNNRALWCNEEFDKILTEATIESDISKRKGLYRQAQTIINQEVPVFPFTHSHKFQAHLTTVTGLKINPYGSITLSKARKR